MMIKQDKSGKAFFVSFLLHVFVLSLFVASFEWSSHNFVIENSESKTPVINAVFINESKLQLPDSKPLPPLQAVAPKKITPAPAPPKAQAEKANEPMPNGKTIAIADPKKKQQEQIEKQLLADLQKAKKQKQKKTKEKELEKAFAKELKAQQALSLEKQVFNEKSRLSSAQQQKMEGIIDKYKALILQSISQNWLIPPGVNKSLSTELLIRIAPGGVVLDVQITKGSGDEGLDRSARTAVFKASPLPVPSNSKEFTPFRQFVLKVRPENILTQTEGLS